MYVTWTNLTLSCETCNRSGKGTYNNDDEPLLDPYNDDIENEILGLGPMIFSRKGSRKGQITIDVLKLNRSELVERRAEKLEKIDMMRRQYENEQNASYKQILLNSIKEEIAADKEYSFIAHEYCVNYGLL